MNCCLHIMLVKIQRALRPGCQVGLGFNGRNWEAIIATEQNAFPYWVKFQASTPGAAVHRLVGYLEGRVPDHAQMKRDPVVFLGGVSADRRLG